MLTPGDPAPWFDTRSTAIQRFCFDGQGGRYIVLCLFGSAGNETSRRALDEIERQHERFHPERLCFFGVSTDPEDERQGRLRLEWPGIIYLWDFDRIISRLYGAVLPDDAESRPYTVVLSPALRALAVFPFADDGQAHARQVLQYVEGLPPVASVAGFAPVLLVPDVFEPGFCRILIEQYERQGSEDSGFMRDVDGNTVTVRVLDHRLKRRRDCLLSDPNLITEVHQRLERRLLPEIAKAFQFRVTRCERHLIACYEPGGHFRQHRDNTTKVTAHRRFAVTLNLNADAYEGGDLRFPEFGARTYRAPTGGAIVFGCSILHEALPVTNGTRYAFLPFLYDEAAVDKV